NNLLMLRLSSALKANLLQAVDLLNQAVARDPSFLQAYCQLACAHDQLYFLGFDHTPARLALAEAAIERAFRLRPDSGETQLAHARDLYHGHLDHGGALAELKLLARLFLMMRGYSNSWVTSRGDRDVGRSLCKTSSAQLTLTRVILKRFSRLRSVTESSGVTLKTKQCSTVR